MKRMIGDVSLPVAMLSLALGLCASVSWADEDDEEPFEIARLFFQMNDTDEDLGIHLSVDGEPWKNLEIDGPNDRRLFYVRTQSPWRRSRLCVLT